jgi:hypothetical protein
MSCIFIHTSRQHVKSFIQLFFGNWGSLLRKAKTVLMQHSQHLTWRILDFPGQECNLSTCAQRAFMPTLCQITGCKNDTPPALVDQKLCVLHFTLSLEASCAAMRRETALGMAPHERQREIMSFITEHGEKLARVATSGLHLTDDLKARILSTFLTLMNLRENLDRANMRSSFGRSGQHRSS